MVGNGVMYQLKPPNNKAASVIRGILDKEGMSLRGLGIELEVPNGSMGDYMRGRTVPPLVIAVQIDDYFGGRVPPRCWLEKP